MKKIIFFLIGTVYILGILSYGIYLYHSFPERMNDGDTLTYVESAKALAISNIFAVSPDMLGVPETVRTPGLPFVISLLIKCGFPPYSLVFVNIFLFIITLFAVYYTGKIMWGKKTALWAVALLAIHIPSFVYVYKIMTETMFTAGISIFLLLNIIAIHYKRSHLIYFIASIVLSISVLTRPIAYYFPLFLCVTYIIIAIIKKHSLKQTMLKMLCMFAIVIIVIAGWRVRNYCQTGYSEFSSIEGINLYLWAGAGTLAARDNRNWVEVKSELSNDKIQTSYARFHPKEGIGKDCKKKAIQIIKENPFSFIKSCGVGFINLIGSPGYELFYQLLTGESMSSPLRDLKQLSFQDYLQKWFVNNFWVLFICIMGITYLGFAYLGCIAWVGLKLKSGFFAISVEEWILLSFLIYFTAVSSFGPHGGHRFRITMAPMFCLFAARGIVYSVEIIYKIFKKKK